MSPPTITRGKPVGQENKSWKKINEERKVFKRERRQESLIKQVENAEKLKELSKANEAAAAELAKKSNPSTISIAVPGSILENAQSPGLRSYLAGQIARAASIFRVNEIIVFDDIGVATARDTKVVYETETNGEEETSVPQTARKSSLQLARILQYLECPQYLRKFFFPLHKDLMHSGLLNPLDTPHHLRQQSMFLYREGIVTERQAKEGRCFVNVGLPNDVLVDKAITPGVRVTIKLKTLNESKKLRGTVVSPDEPRRETGVYWGYTVRIAHSLADVFTKSPYSGGYDRTIGTSDRGSNVQEVPPASCAYNHLLIMFGGLAGLETALANDEKLTADDPALLFDQYLNVLPKQGSRTIRTEEAILIALTALQEKLAPQVPDVEDTEYKELLPRSDDALTKTVNEAIYVESKGNNPFDVTAKNNEDNSTSLEENIVGDPFVASSNNERFKRNPFTTKVNKNERQRKPVENPENFDDEPTSHFKSNTRHPEKSSKFNKFDGHSKNYTNNKSFEKSLGSNPFIPSSNGKRVERNSFTSKISKNDRKRKHGENHDNYNEGTTTQLRLKKMDMSEKSNTERKQNEKDSVVSAEIDDLEVVPASGTMPAKRKNSKQELDLSRFD